MNKKKNWFFYLNHKNLIGEIEQYGYVYSLKNLIITYLSVIVGSILAAFLFKLHVAGYIVIAAFGVLITPFLIRNSYKALYEQRRFSDASKYMEKMLYYFRASGKIITALQNAEEVFHNGEMKSAIHDAADLISNPTFVTDSVTSGSVEEKALKIIEDKYPNKRLKRMHAFFISVEKNGGSADLGTEVQLNDREDWVSDVVARQKEKKRLCRVFIVFSVFVILFCLAFLYLPIFYKAFSFDLSEHFAVRAASVAVIIVTVLLYTKVSSVSGVSWVEEKAHESDEKLAERFDGIVNYDMKKQRKKSFLIALAMAAVTAVFYIITKNKLFTAAGAVIAVFIAASYRFGYQALKDDMSKEIQSAFPEWIIQIALIMQHDTVPMAIAKSYDSAPGILKPEIKKMLLALDEKPTSPVPFNDFMKFFNISEINEAMGALYSVMNAAGSDIDNEIRNVLTQNRKMTQRAAAVKAEDRQAASELYVYAEGGIGCVLMMTDMVYMMLSFLSLTGNM